MKTSIILTVLVTMLPFINALPTRSTIAATGVSAAIRLLPRCLRLIPKPNRKKSSKDRPHAPIRFAFKTLIAMDGAAGTATWIRDIVPVHQRPRADLVRSMLRADQDKRNSRLATALISLRNLG